MFVIRTPAKMAVHAAFLKDKQFANVLPDFLDLDAKHQGKIAADFSEIPWVMWSIPWVMGTNIRVA